MIELISTSLDQTIDLGRRLGQLATPGDVIALDGELGAGKTQLARGLAIGLGLDPAQVSSPTFVLMHEYLNEGQADATALVHIDAYRITGPDDLSTLGYDDELRDNSVTAVEWASRTDAGWWGDHRLHILIEHTPGPANDGHPASGSRRLTLTPHGRWRDRVATLADPPTPAP